jgi:hypothetical protein
MILLQLSAFFFLNHQVFDTRLASLWCTDSAVIMEMYGMTGERLGTIGSPQQEGGNDNLPQWKRELLSKPSISVRRGIAWVSLVLHTPSSPSSALIVTFFCRLVSTPSLQL